MELADHRGQDPQRGGGERSDAYDIAVEAFFTIERLTRGIERVEHFNRMGEKLFADQRQLRAQPPTLKQPRAGELLQFVQRFG